MMLYLLIAFNEMLVQYVSEILIYVCTHIDPNTYTMDELEIDFVANL